MDDIIVTGTDTQGIASLKQHLHHKFSIKDLGLLHYFLGIEVGYQADGIILSQKKFTRELLHDCGLPLKSRASTPLPLHLKLQHDLGTPLSDAEHYRSLVGKLNFLTHTHALICVLLFKLSVNSCNGLTLVTLML